MSTATKVDMAKINRINARCAADGEPNRIHVNEVGAQGNEVAIYSIHHVASGQYQAQAAHDLNHAIFLLQYYNQIDVGIGFESGGATVVQAAQFLILAPCPDMGLGGFVILSLTIYLFLETNNWSEWYE